MMNNREKSISIQNKNNIGYPESVMFEIMILDRVVFLDTIRNMEDIYKKLLEQKAEKAFLNKDNSDFRLYCCPKLCDAFAKYANLQYSPDYRYYVCEHHAQKIIGFFAVDRKGKIVSSEYEFGEEACSRLFSYFGHDLLIYAPKKKEA